MCNIVMVSIHSVTTIAIRFTPANYEMLQGGIQRGADFTKIILLGEEVAASHRITLRAMKWSKD